MRFMFSASRAMFSMPSSRISGSSLPQRFKRLAYPCMTESGVLSSWLASDTKLDCRSSVSCMSSSMSLMRSVSSYSSSRLSTGASRVSRCSASIESMVSIILRTGLIIAVLAMPPTTAPSTTNSTTRMSDVSFSRARYCPVLSIVLPVSWCSILEMMNTTYAANTRPNSSVNMSVVLTVMPRLTFRENRLYSATMPVIGKKTIMSAVSHLGRAFFSSITGSL